MVTYEWNDSHIWRYMQEFYNQYQYHILQLCPTDMSMSTCKYNSRKVTFQIHNLEINFPYAIFVSHVPVLSSSTICKWMRFLLPCLVCVFTTCELSIRTSELYTRFQSWINFEHKVKHSVNWNCGSIRHTRPVLFAINRDRIIYAYWRCIRNKNVGCKMVTLLKQMKPSYFSLCVCMLLQVCHAYSVKESKYYSNINESMNFAYFTLLPSASGFKPENIMSFTHAHYLTGVFFFCYKNVHLFYI